MNNHSVRDIIHIDEELCNGCGQVFTNPKLNEGGAKWRKFADKCLGINPEVMKAANPNLLSEA